MEVVFDKSGPHLVTEICLFRLPHAKIAMGFICARVILEYPSSSTFHKQRTPASAKFDGNLSNWGVPSPVAVCALLSGTRFLTRRIDPPEEITGRRRAQRKCSDFRSPSSCVRATKTKLIRH